MQIHAIDDSGRRYGPVSLPLGAKAAAQFTSRDLEDGNPAKGITSGLGEGEGNWRLELETELDIEPLAYRRDSAFSSLHDVVPQVWPLLWYVPTVNPGSNQSRRSFLRLINPNDTDAEVMIDALDDKGEPPPDGGVRLILPAGVACTISVQNLESGEVSGPCESGLTGRFGDGAGKWQLLISADQSIQVMNLMAGSDGDLVNLSATAERGFGPPMLTPSGAICVRCPFPRYDIIFDRDWD